MLECDEIIGFCNEICYWEKDQYYRHAKHTASLKLKWMVALGNYFQEHSKT